MGLSEGLWQTVATSFGCVSTWPFSSIWAQVNPHHSLHGTVAQLVEQWPFKPTVMGSIPIGPTMKHAFPSQEGVFLLYEKSRS